MVKIPEAKIIMQPLGASTLTDLLHAGWDVIRMRGILHDTRGASAIEYALLAALVGLGIASSAGSLGAGLGDTLEKAGKALGDKEKKDKKDK